MRSTSVYSVIMFTKNILSRWTRVNFNSTLTELLHGLSDAQKVPNINFGNSVSTVMARGQTFYSTRPIIGIFYLTQKLSFLCFVITQIKTFEIALIYKLELFIRAEI